MRQTAVGTQLRAQSIQPAIGITGIGLAGGLVIRFLHGGARNQGQYERDHLQARVVQIAHRGIEIQLHGAATAGVLTPIGTMYPFTGRCRIGTDLLFIDEAVGNQLLRLSAMAALLMVQLPGLLLNGWQACVVNLHGGARKEKALILPVFTTNLGAAGVVSGICRRLRDSSLAPPGVPFNVDSHYGSCPRRHRVKDFYRQICFGELAL